MNKEHYTMFTRDNRSNLIIGILLVIVLVGGVYIVADTGMFNGVFNNDNSEEIIEETELICVNEGDLFEEVCAETERDAVLVALGRTPRTDTEVTVTHEGLTTSGMSSVILERYVVEETEEAEEVVITREPVEPTEAPEPTPEPNNGLTDEAPSVLRLTGFPERATPAYGTWSHEQVNNYVPNTGYILGSPGVIGTHELDEANRNDSAVLITSNQRRFETSPARFALPEGGYTMISTGFGRFEFGDYSLDLPAIEFHEYIIVIRGSYEATSNDRNNRIVISGFNPDFTLATAYDVPAHAGGFMSDLYVWQNVQNSFDDNCGLGDCTSVTLITVDINSGAYTLQEYSEGTWTLHSTNVPVRYR